MIWVTTRRLDWALRTRGSDLATWPAPERAAALALMRRCPIARRMLADRLAAEDLAAEDLAPEGSETETTARERDRCGALLEAMQGRLRRRMVIRAPARPAMRWSMLAACAAAGLYVGVAHAELDATDPFAAVQAVALSDAP